MPTGGMVVKANRPTGKLANARLERETVIRFHNGCQRKEDRTVATVATSSGGRNSINEEVEIVARLKACAKKKDLLEGSQIHEAIRKKDLLQKNIFIGSTLVHMYAKCGALTTAQNVFDELPARNLVTWNALTTGYVQHGQAGKALDCFAQMQGEGLVLDAVTFLSMVKACGSIGAIDLGLKLHQEVLERGWLKTHNALGSAVVDMYGKFGMLEKAQEVFESLPAQNVICWTGLISGYTQHGLCQEALQCFDKMRKKGISPNPITFSCTLKACGSVGALEKGEELHDEIAQKGLLENECVLGTALVDMYAKCGALGKAREVFNELQQKDVIAWNALIAGYFQKGNDLEALEIFNQMKLEGFCPDITTFCCILRACGSIGKADEGKKIHDEIIERGLLVKHPNLHTALVDMYAKCGSFKVAKDMFNSLSFQDADSFDSLISGYCRHGHVLKALECIDQMQRKGTFPNASTFASILRACGRNGETEIGENLHSEVLRLGLVKETEIVGSALVDMYVRFGALAKAQEVVDTLQMRDLKSWTSLIKGYCEHGEGEQALHVFCQMKQEGLLPDDVTFACILKTCGSILAIDMGIDLHAEIERKDLLEKSDMLRSALVDMYAKCGAMIKAQEVIDRLSVRDVVTWTALIDGYCQHKQSDEALHCFEQMRIELLTPDAVTFACILKVCGSIGAVETGEKVHDDIVRSGLFGKDTVLGIALVDMYAKCGALRKANQLFDELPIHNVVMWNVLMSAYCQQGLGDEVLKCFDRMNRDGISPDAVTFVSVLKACGNTNVEVSTYFEMMKVNYGIIPKLEHYCCMVEVLGRAGQFEKALSFVTKMPSCDRLEGWASILSACRKRGNVALGKLAFENMLRFDETYAAPCVMMSDIYGAAGMQEESKRIKDARFANQVWH